MFRTIHFAASGRDRGSIAPSRLVLLSMAIAGLASPALAQSTTTELPPITVQSPTDTRLAIRKKETAATAGASADAQPGAQSSGAPNADAPQGGAGASSASGILTGAAGLPGTSATVITRERIERAPQATLADIIAAEAGVQSTSLYGGVNGNGTTVDVRGFGSTAASNTLVLINGRRLNDWDIAGFDLSTIAKDSVERIEILRGNSGAVLYGDGAVGGVINIVTRTAAGQPNRARVEGGFGSAGTGEGNVSASGSWGAFSAYINANRLRSDGWRVNNELEQTTVVGDFRWTFAKGSVYVNIGADDQHVGLPGPRRVTTAGINQVVTDPRGSNTPFDYADKTGARATVGFSYMLDRNVELIVDAGVRKKSQIAAFFSPFEENFVDTDLVTRSFTPRLNITSSFFGLPSRAIMGIDAYDTSYTSNRSRFEGLAPFHAYRGGQETLAGYAQQTVTILPTTDVVAGARIQRTRTTARDRYDPLAPANFPDVEGSPLDDTETNHAWNVGVEHRLIPGITLLGRVAQSFRVGNIDERIGAGYPTNFDLRTQKSHDWEAGVRFQDGPFTLQTSYYVMNLTDEIQYSPATFSNTNLDPTQRKGIDTIASWQMLRNLRLFGNVTYTDAMFREGSNAGNQVPLVSRWSGNLGLSWAIIDKALTFDTIVRYVGDRRMDNDQANFQPLISAHTTLDARLAGSVDQFFWSASVQNLFDVKYFDYAVASPSTYGTYNAYTQPGRTVMVKAGVTW